MQINFFERLETKLTILICLLVFRILTIFKLEFLIKISLIMVLFVWLFYQIQKFIPLLCNTWLFQFIYFCLTWFCNFIYSSGTLCFLFGLTLGFSSYFFIYYPNYLDIYLFIFFLISYYDRFNKHFVFSEVTMKENLQLVEGDTLDWNSLLIFFSATTKRIFGTPLENKLTLVDSKIKFPYIQQRYMRRVAQVVKDGAKSAFEGGGRALKQGAESAGENKEDLFKVGATAAAIAGAGAAVHSTQVNKEQQEKDRELEKEKLEFEKEKLEFEKEKLGIETEQKEKDRELEREKFEYQKKKEADTIDSVSDTTTEASSLWGSIGTSVSSWFGL